MIRLLDPGDALRFPEPLIGCRIETLAGCYGDLQGAGAPRLYRSGQGGVLCHFGDTLLLSGRCAARELLPFASALGIRRIEARSAAPCPGEEKIGWSSYPVLAARCRPAASQSPPPIASSEEMRRVFSLLCESDDAFAAEAQYLPWLSDLTRRRNRGYAQVYLLDGMATACLSAIAGRYAYLSMVAVSPGARRMGLGSRLIGAILSDCAARPLTVLTAAQHPGLLSFYQKAGFVSSPFPLLTAGLSQSNITRSLTDD